ncbi:hypothetical protein I350_01331 [Cryptococcus amylolentus CBS 6273]|uniref:RAM signaling network component n=1 Tax=Cryptococcus amylolentus CBS 6273 TaxID=1296118 RepID=A0A1E3KCB4_9TREE|nr:hypothetical protein I350_01331 [Cryptococcus amylolentus CBS 6273]
MFSSTPTLHNGLSNDNSGVNGTSRNGSTLPPSNSSSHLSEDAYNKDETDMRSGLRVDTDFLSKAPSQYGDLILDSSSSREYHNAHSPIEPVVKGELAGEGVAFNSRNDVELAVRGLRDLSSPSPPPPPPKSTNRPGAGAAPSVESESRITPSISNASLDELSQRDQQTLKLVEEALQRSEDEGDTLDLSRRAIDRIGDRAVDMFNCRVGKNQKGVWRLALSYNLLRDNSIVDSFGKLSRLRYLNLKGNHFTKFPVAITQIPALEILDFSKNKLVSFPDDSGHLVRLKVLSLTNNEIVRLPENFVKFGALKVFKIDQNPIEWPPRSILGPLCESISAGRSKGSSHDRKRGKEEDLRPWIESVKLWMRQNNEPQESGQPKGSLGYQQAEESSQPAIVSSASEMPLGPAQPAPRPWQQDQRSDTHDSTANNIRSTLPNVNSHARNESTASYISPPSSSTDASFRSHARSPSVTFAQNSFLSAQSHTRGGSYSPGQSSISNLTAKKSLPDLRLSHARIIEERRGDMGGEMATGTGSIMASMPSHPYRSSTSVAVEGDTSPSPDLAPDVDDLTSLSEKRSSQDRVIDESRNSYFRRLSTLPTSTISKAIPVFLLRFIDATRGILFAISQLHSSLRQYINFAVNERVAGTFKRVMEPAGVYMNRLINALDRFDAMSRRGTPPTAAIRNVLDAAKESVSVFGKVAAVLKMQVPAMRGNDIRYTRTLMVNVYGATAEMASSWKVMAGLMPEAKVLLFVDATGSRIPFNTDSSGGQPMAATGSFTGRAISPIIERQESHSPQSIRSEVLATGHDESLETPLGHQGRRRGQGHPLSKERRHAGSYSGQDVERGMMMGSPLPEANHDSKEDEYHHARAESGTITLPSPEDEETSEYGASNHAMAHMDHPHPPFAFEKRGHHPSSSSGSSHAMSLASGFAYPRKLSVDVRPPTPASATLFDEDLLDVIETATEVAFTSWLRLSEDIGASPSLPNHGIHHQSQSSNASSRNIDMGFGHTSKRPSNITPKQHTELIHLLSVAEQTTATLRESLMRLRANPSSLPTTTLPDDAQAFIKIVVKVSELVKAISGTHSFPVAVRQTVGRLTQATRECAILIQVSSLRPGQGTPAPIPPSHSASSRSAFFSSRTDLGSEHSIDVASSHDEYEDIAVPPSAGYAAVHHGLRDLQLPSKQAAIGRSRSANATVPGQGSLGSIAMPIPYVSGGAIGGRGVMEAPRSAQPGQVFLE